MSLFSGVSVNTRTQEVLEKPSSWTEVRVSGVIQSLKDQGVYEQLKPTENEIKYVEGVYISGNYNDINNIKESFVQSLGDKELKEMSNKFDDFISNMNLVASENTGLYDLMSDLSKETKAEEFKEIWEKALNAKPTLLASLIGIFNNGYKERSVLKKVDMFSGIIERKGKLVGEKIKTTEMNLIQQSDTQKKNIQVLQDTFEVYYKAVEGLKKQYIFSMYVRYNFKLSLEKFKEDSKDSKSIEVNKKLVDLQRLDTLIDNKCLLMQKSLQQILIAVNNNNNLIMACYSLLSEIENTITHSLPNIRSNLVTIAVALRTEKGLKENQYVQRLDEQQASLASKISGDLAVKTESLMGSNRLREASAIEKLVNDAIEIDKRVDVAKQNRKKDIDNAEKIMQNAQHKLNDLISNKLN